MNNMPPGKRRVAWPGEGQARPACPKEVRQRGFERQDIEAPTNQTQKQTKNQNLKDKEDKKK